MELYFVIPVAPHITAVCKFALLHLRNISMIWEFVTTDITKTLVHAFVTSKIDSCNSLLYGAPIYLLHRLQRVLNCAGRIVYQSKKYDHITPLLEEFHWLPIEQKINFKILLITFKVLHNQAPTHLIDLVTHYHPSRLLRSSSKNLLGIQTYNLKTYGGRSFAAAAPVQCFGIRYPNLSKILHHLTLLNAGSKSTFSLVHTMNADFYFLHLFNFSERKKFHSNSGQRIATFQHNIVGCSMLCAFGHPAATCCDMLGVVGSNLKMAKFFMQHLWMLHGVVVVWPGSRINVALRHAHWFDFQYPTF